MDEEQIAPSSELQDKQWETLAQKYWQGNIKKPEKVKIEVVEKEIWAVLHDKHFEYTSLLALERLQLLER